MEHEIINLPSASTLAVLRRETAGRTIALKTIAVLADPVFTSEDARVKRARPKDSGKAVVMNLSAKLLKPGDYKLTLTGMTDRGETQEIDSYYFSVVKIMSRSR